MMTLTTYVDVGRDAYEFKKPARFRLTFTEIGNGTCPTEPGPNVQDAGDAESSNKDALILGKILHARYQADSLSARVKAPRSCKAHLTTRAKLQPPTIDVTLVEMDTRTVRHSSPKRYL